ncbi:MAG: hypothetical protein ACFFAE_21555 [Candidatus Hodarchaeota archaeon]
MVMPVSAGIPRRLQRVMDDPSATQIHRFGGSLVGTEVVWNVPVNQPAYILHGFSVVRVGSVSKDIKDWVKENLWRPYFFETIIDGQEIVMQRFSEALDFVPPPPPEAIGWSFYHIFKPGDLPVGDHEFNMIWYTGKENGKRVVAMDLFELWYDYILYWYQIEITALIIRVV